MDQERLGPSYFFTSLVLGPLNNLVPSSRYTHGLGWSVHCGVCVLLLCVCFITAGPITKLCACVEVCVYYCSTCVCVAKLFARGCVFITAVPITKLFAVCAVPSTKLFARWEGGLKNKVPISEFSW